MPATIPKDMRVRSMTRGMVEGGTGVGGEAARRAEKQGPWQYAHVGPGGRANFELNDSRSQAPQLSSSQLMDRLWSGLI